MIARFAGARYARDGAVAAGLVLIALLISARWAHIGSVIYNQDTFWLSDPWNQMRQQVFVWNDYLSIAGRPRFGLIIWPYLLLQGVLSHVFGDALGQMLAIGTIVGAGWASAYALLRLLRFSTLPALLGATAYAFNPWTQTTLPFAYTVLWCFFAAPATIALLIGAARFPQHGARWRLGLVGVWAFVAPVVATNPGTLSILVLLTFFGVALAWPNAADKVAYRRWLVITAAYVLLSSLWWFVPMFFTFLAAPAGNHVASGAQWVVGRASLDNVVRFLMLWPWGLPNYLTYAQDYDGNPLSYASSYTLIVIGVLCIPIRKPERAGLVRLCLGTALLALFLSKGLHEPLAWFNALLYKLPGSAVWREPSTKFPLIALLALSICCSAFFERLLSLRSEAWWRPALAGSFALILAISSQGFLGDQTFTGDTLNEPSSYVTIPAYWFAAADWLNRQPSDGSVLVLPADLSYQAAYRWGMQAIDLLPSDVFHRHTIVLGDIDYVASALDNELIGVLDGMIARGSPNVSAALHELGVRYVLFRGDIVQPGAVASAHDVRRLLPAAGVSTFGPLTLFDIGATVPPVNAGRTWVAGKYRSQLVTAPYEFAGLLEDAPRIDWTQFGPSGPSVNPSAQEIDAGPVPSAPADPSGATVAGAHRRYIWHAPTRTFSARLNGDDAVVAAALYDPLSRRATYLVSPRRTRTQLPEATLLSEIGAEQIDARHLAWSIVNPSDAPIRADLELSVVPGQTARYALTLGKRTSSDVVDAERQPVWLRFNGVTLIPGLNQLFVQESNAGSGRHAQPSGSLLGDLRVLARGNAPKTGARTRRATFASIPMGMAVISSPTITADIASPPTAVELGATINFSSGGKRFRCYAPFDANAKIHVESAIISCARIAGVEPIADFVNAARALTADLDALLLPGATDFGKLGVRALRIEWTPRGTAGRDVQATVGSSVSELREGRTYTFARPGKNARVGLLDPTETSRGIIGYPRSRDADPPGLALHGAPELFGWAKAADEFVQLRQAYSPTWLAFCWGNCRSLPEHLQDRAGWNDWWVAGSGTVVFANVLVILQWLAAMVSAATLVFASLAAARQKAIASHA